MKKVCKVLFGPCTCATICEVKGRLLGTTTSTWEGVGCGGGQDRTGQGNCEFLTDKNCQEMEQIFMFPFWTEIVLLFE